MPPKQGSKRKEPPGSSSARGGSVYDHKRAKITDARNIPAQLRDKALNEKGELDLAAFVKSREFEINALEQGIKNSKHGLATRAFQEVPRELRRRTASHNTKRIPKRLRKRAEKEIKEDNTPTGSARKKDLITKQRLKREIAKKGAAIGARAQLQRDGLAKQQKAKKASSDQTGQIASEAVKTVTYNKGNEAPAAINPIRPPNAKKDVLAKHLKPVTKFRKRQKEKMWLPTHIYHAKRAHMTLPSQPLWGFAIPLSPTEKVYRTTHRAANMRGCVAWDVSYMSTLMLEGVENSLISTFRVLNVAENMLTGPKGLRWREGSRSWQGWLRERDKPNTWIGEATVIWRAQMQVPFDTVGDGEYVVKRRQVLLRVHPVDFPKLWKEILKVAKMQKPSVSLEDLRYSVGSIEVAGPAAAEALVGVLNTVQDDDNSNQVSAISKKLAVLARVTDTASLPTNVLMDLAIHDPRLFHPPRPIDLSEIGDSEFMQFLANWPSNTETLSASIFDRDARFAADRLQSSQKAINRRKGEAGPGNRPKPSSSDPRIPAMIYATQPYEGDSRSGSWILMLPWNWILPTWTSLMYFPLSTGGNPRLGGLQEKMQLSFEHQTPFYPVDFPGTRPGLVWSYQEGERQRKAWESRPKAKRVEWTTLDLGSGKKGEIGKGWACDWPFLFAANDSLYKNLKFTTPDKAASSHLAVPHSLRQILTPQLRGSKFSPLEGDLMTVRLTMVQRGVPASCARIYRLPSDDGELRQKWLSLLEANPKASGKLVLNLSRAKTKKEIARLGDPVEDFHPAVPGERDLIGFVTTGNFNLGEGQGTGIGSIALCRVWSTEFSGKEKIQGVCIVRNAGTSMGRLALWSSV